MKFTLFRLSLDFLERPYNLMRVVDVYCLGVRGQKSPSASEETIDVVAALLVPRRLCFSKNRSACLGW